MKNVCSIIVQTRIISLVFLLTMSCLQFIGCQDKPEENKPKEEMRPLASPPQVTVAIAKIDDMALQTGTKPQVARQVMVEGTISDPNVIICVLVHPMATDTWWTQNLPSPPEKIEDQSWRWRTMALCGTETLGLNEDFEIVAIAESRRNICQLGKTIKMEEFPKDLPRSAIITVRRDRN